MISFTEVVHRQYNKMAKDELFTVNVDNIFARYLEAFPPGADPVYRKRTVHDCQCCKQFVRRLGTVVGIKDNKVITVWDDQDVPAPYDKVFAAMRDIVLAAPITGVFRSKEREYGTEHNYDKKNERYDHFHGQVLTRHYAAYPETKIGDQNAVFQVCQRGLSEIKMEDLSTVLELIDSNALYRGEEHRPALLGFRDLLQKYTAAPYKTLFVWENLSNRNARFRNTVIGTLLVDLSEGKDLETAVKGFETKVAPMNYKRPTTLITQKMVEQAVQTLTDLGLGGAIYRRYARLSDVSVNDVLFVDNDTRGKMRDGVSELLSSSVKAAPLNTKATAIDVETFLKTVLPGTKTLEVLLENRHSGNFISLTGGDGSERLFKWDNNFAWSYEGDVTDSVKQRVKAAGGNVDAKLRVSLSWYNFDDLDIHCEAPHHGHIFFGNKCGILDVDMNAGGGSSRSPVENLAFQKLHDGVYKVYVNQYNRRETVDTGFAIEVEYEGQIHQYSYPKAVSGNVPCLTITVKNGAMVKVDSPLTGGNASKEKWGVKTETRVKVSALLFSPNHWGEQKVGQRHLIFALQGCKNPDPTRGIYNEFLRGDLDKHRKVFEVLGSKTKCTPTDDQISGVGFTSARGDSVTVVVDGRRSYTITF